jgi:hypothetical protein
VVDVSTELGQAQFDYLRKDRSRSYALAHEGPDTYRFHYAPGNRPFAGPDHDHRMKIARPALLAVTGGDWRGNPRGIAPVVHQNVENWADDFATHQERLVRAQN